MTLGILLLPLLSLGYLAYEIRNGNNEILSGSTVIEKGSMLVKDQAEILTKLDLVNDLSLTFTQMQNWLSDLALSLQNESEEQVNMKHDKFTELLTQIESTESQLSASLRPKSQKYFDTMMLAVDAYTDDNRILGNSLVAESRRLAATIDTVLEELLSSTASLAKEAGDKMASGNEAIVAKNRAIIDKNTAILKMSLILPAIAADS